MRWFRPYTPPPDLAGVLDCRYAATTTDARHQLIPDGCMDLVWVDGDALVCGPDTRSWSIHYGPGTEIVGLRFRPGAAAGVFRFAAVDLRDVRVRLVDLVGEREAREVGERLAEADGVAARLQVAEDLVRLRAAGVDPDGTVELASLVASDPAFGAERLAAQTGVSSRQLRRRFDQALGYGPAFFARIARLQRFARLAARTPQRGLAELAASAGYVDQSHLAKDCRAIVGVTPRRLVDLLPGSSLTVTRGDFRSVQDAPMVRGRRSVA